MPAEKLLTAREVAEALNVSLRTVWLWAKSGKLPPSTHKGHRTRWRREVVAAVKGTLRPGKLPRSVRAASRRARVLAR